MKRYSVVATIVFLFLLSGCKTNEQEVPLIIYDFEDLYMQDFKNVIYEENTYDSFTYKSYDSKNSQIIQNDAVNEVLEYGSNVMIINAVDRLGVYPLIEKAHEQGVSIIFINREPLKEDLLIYENLYYVGAKPEQSAIYQAEIVMDLFGGNSANLNELDKNGDNIIQCVLLKGEPGHQDAEIRTQKVIEELLSSGFSVEILSTEEAYFSQSIAYSKMKDFLEVDGNEVEVVISNNDAMAIGAIEALKEGEYFEDNNFDGVIDRETEIWIPVIGIDGLPIALDLIEQGYLYGTVFNDSESMAKAINELTFILLNDKDIKSFSYLITDDRYVWIDYKKIY
jgi:methyl-galactoside transport system substrate-binding protein